MNFKFEYTLEKVVSTKGTREKHSYKFVRPASNPGYETLAKPFIVFYFYEKKDWQLGHKMTIEVTIDE